MYLSQREEFLPTVEGWVNSPEGPEGRVGVTQREPLSVFWSQESSQSSGESNRGKGITLDPVPSGKDFSGF